MNIKESIFLEKVNKNNPTIKIIGKYINMSTKIKCECLLCGRIWDGNPHTLAKGHSCFLCASKKRNIKNKITPDQFLLNFNKYNNHLILLSEYNGLKNKIKIKCKKCNFIWSRNAEFFNVSKIECPVCKKEKNYIFLKEKNKINFIKKLKEKHKNIKLIGDYINSQTKTKFRCTIHNFEWMSIPNNLFYRKSPCNLCKKEKIITKITEEEFFKSLPEKIKKEITFIGKYLNTVNKIKVKCNLCGREWYALPSNLKKNHGCINCNRHNKKTHEQFIKELSKKNKDILILEKYINTNTKIKFKCLKCNKIHKKYPFELLQGRGCHRCNKSLGEKKISLWLDIKNIKYIEQKIFDDCFFKKPLKFDFYLPYYNLCIEYDGEQHFSKTYHWITNDTEFLNIKIRDNIKNEYCKNNNITLLRIPYTEFRNIDNILQTNIINENE